MTPNIDRLCRACHYFALMLAGLGALHLAQLFGLFPESPKLLSASDILVLEERTFGEIPARKK